MNCETAANLGTYRAWKRELLKSGRTLEDAVEMAESQGGSEYGRKIKGFIEEMEALEKQLAERP